jgi:hypothetical protein
MAKTLGWKIFPSDNEGLIDLDDVRLHGMYAEEKMTKERPKTRVDPERVVLLANLVNRFGGVLLTAEGTKQSPFEKPGYFIALLNRLEAMNEADAENTVRKLGIVAVADSIEVDECAAFVISPEISGNTWEQIVSQGRRAASKVPGVRRILHTTSFKNTWDKRLVGIVEALYE